jgi:hypothetical protein
VMARTRQRDDDRSILEGRPIESLSFSLSCNLLALKHESTLINDFVNINMKKINPINPKLF